MTAPAKHTAGPSDEADIRAAIRGRVTELEQQTTSFAYLYDPPEIDAFEREKATLQRLAPVIAAAPDLLAALRRTDQLIRVALPKFNWGASALDANAIRLLNEVPGEVSAAIAKAEGRA